MTIYFYKGFTRNSEIVNTPVWVLSHIWRLGQVRDTIFGTDVSNKMLLNAAKCQGYSFYRFWVIKEKPAGRGEAKITPTKIRVNMNIASKGLLEAFFMLFCLLLRRPSY